MTISQEIKALFAKASELEREVVGLRKANDVLRKLVWQRSLTSFEEAHKKLSDKEEQGD